VTPKTLPCGTRVRVTNQGSGQSVTVTINDRGPFMDGRVIGNSYQVFSLFGG
jgi:rare lipoprotein A